MMKQSPETASVTSAVRLSGFSVIGLLFKLVLRELRCGLAGFGIFLGCLTLGVAAIAAVGSSSRSLNAGLASAGTRILGGDLSFSLMLREISSSERAVLERFGQVSSLALLRAMALSGSETALVEIKAVDGRYPTVGSVETEPSLPLDRIFAPIDGIYGAAADDVLFERLGLAPGAFIDLGGMKVQLRARLISEPDKLGAGIGFGPRLLMSQEALRASDLLQPGSLVRWTYRLNLAESDLSSVQESIDKALPQIGWEVRTRDRVEPRFSREVERFSQFLTLVGLTALLVGGVGVANAVNAYVDRKRLSFAILKSIGASGGVAVSVYFATVLAIATIGIVAGCLIGMIFPFVLAELIGAMIPVPVQPEIAWDQLLLAGCYGYLVAIVFAIAPLGRMHDVPVSSLFREGILPGGLKLRRRYWFILGLCIVVLVGISVISAYDRKIALIFIMVIAASFAILRGVSALAIWVARRMPRTSSAVLRLAMANIYRPGSVTSSLVLSLGLGVTLLVTLNVVDANLRNELTKIMPEKAPNFFFLNIPAARSQEFDALLNELAPAVKIDRVPNMRGRIVMIKDKSTSTITPPPEISWVLEGDRGITYSATLPEGSQLVAGEWWAPDYKGKPLVSFESKIANALGLTIGDDVSVNVLGRTVTARVANLRTVNWRSLGINYVMVFSPNTFAGAPYTNLATAILPPEFTQSSDEGKILRRIAVDFPTVTVVKVKEQLQAFNGLIEQLLSAVRGISFIALFASLMVLAGALAVNQRARLYDAVVLKTLGATRWRLISVYGLEYGFLGVVTAVFGIVMGLLTAFFIITHAMGLSFSPQIAQITITSLAVVLVVVILGLSSTWRILKQKPSSLLKEL